MLRVSASDNIDIEIGKPQNEVSIIKKSLWVIGLAAALALTVMACKKRNSGPKVETVAGVTLIHSPATPLHPNKSVVFEEEFTYSETDARGRVRLFKPSRFAVDAQDNVYIADNSDMAIKVFDAQGNYLRFIGRKGNGPGEFASIRDIIRLPNGRLLVTDFQTRRTSFFDAEGQFLSSFSWKTDFDEVFLADDGSCLMDGILFDDAGPKLFLKKIDSAGEEVLDFGKFYAPQFKKMQIGGGVAWMAVVWSPASAFAGDEVRQWLYHCPGDRYLVEVYDRQAKLIRKIDRPYECVAVIAEDIEELRSRFAGNPDSPAAKFYQQVELPNVKPVTNRMIVDCEGSLWVQTNEVKKEGKVKLTAYDIFSADGFYDARVWLEARPELFANGRMYRMDEDEATGLRRLKRYKIIWNER